MTTLFNFYPSDESETIMNVSGVTGVQDEFGCIEKDGGLYVPTSGVKSFDISVKIDDELNIFGE